MELMTDKNNLKEIKIKTPLKDSVNINIIERSIANKFLDENEFSVEKKVLIALQRRNLYKFATGEVLIDYTINDFLIYIQNYEDAIKLLSNHYHSTIVLHKKEQTYYYSFEIYNDFFKKLELESLENTEKKYERYFHLPLGAKVPYHTKYTDQDNVLFYFRRSESLYHGTWYPDIKVFEYFYDFSIPELNKPKLG